MASLIEELVYILDKELKVYRDLLSISKEKTQIIVNNKLEELQQLTEKEQIFTSRVSQFEKRREEIINDIAIVINRRSDELTINKLIELIGNSLKEQEQLVNIYDEFKSVLDELKQKNELNKKLIEQSLDFINFTVNAIQSSKMAPQTAHYENKGYAGNNYSSNSMFDRKR